MGPPRRTVNRNALRREIVVFTEGIKTEIQYLSHWHRLHRASVLVTFGDFDGAPLPLVEHAVDRKMTDQREERKGRGTAPAETWCIFDTDEHPSIPEALDLAARNGVCVALSNPCLELWFLIHFRTRRRGSTAMPPSPPPVDSSRPGSPSPRAIWAGFKSGTARRGPGPRRSP
jgi:hypothetical protein